jgi:hypothetical protein
LVNGMETALSITLLNIYMPQHSTAGHSAAHHSTAA